MIDLLKKSILFYKLANTNLVENYLFDTINLLEDGNISSFIHHINMLKRMESMGNVVVPDEVSAILYDDDFINIIDKAKHHDELSDNDIRVLTNFCKQLSETMYNQL